jgi:3-hydroxyacyl-CoA dehydrogenase
VLFRELMSNAQSAALRYSFFADRSAPRWKLPGGASIANTKPGVVKSVAVIGAGTMGSGIAVCLIRAGFPVLLVEQNDKLLQSSLVNIGKILQDSVKLNRLTVDQRTECLRILRGITSIDTLTDVDLVIEAVYENLKLKQELFAKLDKICKPSALLCSNTSTLDIDKIASATNRPDKVAGMHFFAPAYIMKLLENVYGAQTSPSTVATIMDVGKKIGKVTVLAKTCDGFVANRMNRMLGNEATFLLEEGALPQDVDRVLEDFGMAMGVFRVSDLSGTDIGWLIRQERAKEMNIELTYQTRYLNGERYSSLPDRLYEHGRYGQKTGKGWYRYEKPFARTAYPDPDINDIIINHCNSLGIKRQVIPPQDIIERCLFAAINEGFRVLEEGVAEKPENIDVIWQYGLGFPRFRGGPMFYASQVGLKKVYERVCHYHEAFPYSSYWVPSDLLRKLAQHNTEVPIDQWANYGKSKL